MKNNRNVIRRTAVGMLAGALLVSGASLAPLPGSGAQLIAHAAEAAADKDTVPPQNVKSEDIRVALFANLSKGSPGETARITMSSTSKLQIAARHNAESIGIVDAGTEQVRFSADDYKVKLIETKDKAVATAVLKKAQASDDAIMSEMQRRGTTFYAIYVGSYPTGKAANQALTRLKNDGSVVSLLKGYEPTVAGPHYMQTGTYASSNEAKAVQKMLLDADVDAFVVSMISNGQLLTSVWAGQAESEAQLEQTKASIERKNLSVSVRPAQAQGALIHTLEETGTGSLTHLRVNGTVKWLVKPAEPTNIKISERYERAYRGEMEVSLHNGELALVNEVPLEQYLISVVGGEVYSSWPQEALKAQAVAARTFALYQGTKFEIANVVDTTLSQAYYGVEKEHPNIKKAVEDTAGEVLMQNGKLIEAIFNSNAGGKTADPSEVWGGSYDYFQVVDSPDDAVQEGKKSWYHVVMPDGKSGYIREDVVDMTERHNEAGFALVSVQEDGTNIRPNPAIQSDVNPIAKVNKGTSLAVIETVAESTEMNWVRGPYTSEQITSWLKSRTKTALNGSVTSLEITERGPSGRAVKIEANGVQVDVSYPDNFRYAFGGLPSTLFDIVSTDAYTAAGVDGKTKELNGVGGAQTVSGTNQSDAKVPENGVKLGANEKSGIVNSEPSFLFVGKGNGHGVGMSQWGAKGLSDQGYDYKKILQYYYKNVELVKR
ncbi:SpoIID/LytB domain-containing protein [Paenibacillus profundus]|uniref:SpoIID/LytB domain-containing protein n=1 Tax=Paenibacillus profundus TaxID=1173085 RepID=A0ABS8YQ45_9BACL|nr:SpoIID/LytB domain-containing protein [Paenibacillus profundus]MCE5171714.1 SpoIID/LytB domain-containing protein [Paenibacillus profundus]